MNGAVCADPPFYEEWRLSAHAFELAGDLLELGWLPHMVIKEQKSAPEVDQNPLGMTVTIAAHREEHQHSDCWAGFRLRWGDDEYTRSYQAWCNGMHSDQQSEWTDDHDEAVELFQELLAAEHDLDGEEDEDDDL